MTQVRNLWEFLRFFQLQRRVKIVSYKNIIAYAVKQIIICQQVAEFHPIVLAEPELILSQYYCIVSSWQKTGNWGCAGWITPWASEQKAQYLMEQLQLMLECVEQTLVNNLCTGRELLDEKVLEKWHLNKTQISSGYQKNKPGFMSMNTKLQQQSSISQWAFLAHWNGESGNNEWNVPTSSKIGKASQKANRENWFYIGFTAPKFCWKIFHSSRCFLGKRARDAVISNAVLLLSWSDHTAPSGRREGNKWKCPTRRHCLGLELNALYSSVLLPWVLYLTLLWFCLCFAGILFLSWVRAGMCVSVREWAWGCRLHLTANNILAGNLQEIKLGA